MYMFVCVFHSIGSIVNFFAQKVFQELLDKFDCSY
jgi:hypothetical protein